MGTRDYINKQQKGDNMTVEEWQGTEDSGWKRCNACYGVFQSGDNVQKCCRNYDSPEYYTVEE